MHSIDAVRGLGLSTWLESLPGQGLVSSQQSVCAWEGETNKHAL